MAFLKRRTAAAETTSDPAPPRPAKPHDVLCERAARFLRNNGFGVVFTDSLRAVSGTGESPDAMGFRNGSSCLIEVKCSRADFLADRKKHFRIAPSDGMGDWRFYLCEPGIIEVADLPDGWGLLYVVGRQVKKVHGWPGNALWYTHKPFNGNKHAEVDYLYSALRRVVQSGNVNAIYGASAEKKEPA